MFWVIVGLIYLALVAGLAAAIVSSREGYQDERGFHYGKPPRD